MVRDARPASAHGAVGALTGAVLAERTDIALAAAPGPVAVGADRSGNARVEPQPRSLGEAGRGSGSRALLGWVPSWAARRSLDLGRVRALEDGLLAIQRGSRAFLWDLRLRGRASWIGSKRPVGDEGAAALARLLLGPCLLGSARLWVGGDRLVGVVAGWPSARVVQLLASSTRGA